MHKFLIVLLLVFTVGCAPARNGYNADRAVIVREERTSRGIKFEHDYTAQYYPGSKWVMQQLRRVGNRMYDVVTIVMLDGKQYVIWFDINKFYGKW